MSTGSGDAPNVTATSAVDGAFTGIVFDEDAEQLPVSTVTLSVTLPEAGAVNVIEAVPLPDVMVPPVIDHEYVVPAGPELTEAMLPVELAVSEAGAVMVAFGVGLTETVCDALAEQPLASVTVTL